MRRLTLLSGSKLALASLCSWWAQPGVEHCDVGPVTERRVGTAVHAAIQRFVDTGSSGLPVLTSAPADPDDETIDRLYSAWRQRYALEFGGAKGVSEVTYAFDTATRAVRVLGIGLDRQYEEAGILPTEIPVTVDLVRRADGALTVFDWKTGAQRNRQPISEHTQLRVGGFCAAKAAPADAVRIVASYIDEDGVTEHDATLDEFDFAAIEEELVALHASVLAAPDPRPGPHCADQWCGAIASCPAVAKAKDAVLAADAPSPGVATIVTSNAAAIRTPEQAAQIHTMLSQVDALSKAMWRALDAYVDANGPVPIDGGKVYAAVEKSRDSIRLDDAAVALVREKLGEHALTAIKTSLTKEAIKDATMAMVGGGKKRTALEAEIMAGLEALGAVRVSSFTTHEAIKPKKTEAA